MSFRYIRFKRLIICFVILLLFLLSVYNFVRNQDRSGTGSGNSNIIQLEVEKPRLAILVPFRDRFDELLVFVPHLTDFLKSQRLISFKIHILNQSRKYRFNRGSLANVGYLLTKNQSDYIAIHDVDLIPVNKNLSYSYPKYGPYHLSSPEYHPQYNYSKYFGGILLINNNQFEQVNGMSNRYFGWGLEDDEFFTRIRAARLPISKPENLTTNRSNTFLHFHYNRKRDTFKTKEQREKLRYRDRITGLSDVKYAVSSSHNLSIDGQYECTIYNIELFCDTKQTPWCLHSYTQQLQ